MSWPDQSAVRGGGGATTQQQQMFGDISLGSAHAPSPIPAALQQQLESLRGPRASSTASAQSILGLGGGGGGHGTSVLDQGALLLPPVVHMPIGGDSASQLHNSSTAGGAAAAASSGQQQQGSPVNRPTISRALSFQ